MAKDTDDFERVVPVCRGGPAEKEEVNGGALRNTIKRSEKVSFQGESFSKVLHRFISQPSKQVTTHRSR
ncbi:hypothetical protein DPEC_G00047870 [Dallia pectoralis]|uniref:Uncharacterized protein n=1 Tax=Dallia pectoralis TaxID=75939 RepID=A0ACC2HAQ5_DALPE|nr:hypothetical protein DPEC_G00047870 [Dallia pectoralis]